MQGYTSKIESHKLIQKNINNMFVVILLVMTLKKMNLVYLNFKNYLQELKMVIFPNVTYADINNGIPEFFMYMVNDGFSLFGLEVKICTYYLINTQVQL